MNIFSIFTAALLYLAINSIEAADSQEFSELVRASMIEKVARFIEWPAWDTEEFKLCVPVDDPLLPAMERYYATISIADKPVKLSTYKQFSTIKDCQAIYLSENQKDDLPGYHKFFQNRPVLIVAEIQDAVAEGIAIDFFVKDNRLNLEVNRSTLTNSGFKVSYHLLKVARIVE